MLENGLDYCTCKRKDCERFGKCAACIEYHTTKSRRYPQPYCQRERKEKKSPAKTDHGEVRQQ